MITHRLIVGLTLLCIIVLAAFPHGGRAKKTATKVESGFDTIVDKEGRISLPKADFRRDWTMLGVWVVNGDEGAEGLHNVYAHPDVVEYFRKNSTFPDGAVLVKELLKTSSSDYTTGHVSFATEIEGWFVMVKDRIGRFRDNPIWGDGWGWAYFKSDAPDQLVTKNYKDECLSCHVPAKSTDWIYTEGYPVLGAKATQNERIKAQLLEPDQKSRMAEKSDALAKAGAKVFNRCKACHSLEPGQHKTGPSLAGVIGRKAGSLEGFNYSQEMKSSGVVWTNDTLDKHLSDVPGFIPGNRMGKVFPAGVKKATDRQALIAFLKTK